MKKLLISTLLLIPASYSLAATTVNTALGEVYADQAGKTLYTFTKDPLTKSVCYDECEKLWPPMWVDEETKSEFAKLNAVESITRNDGRQQWTLAGKPLYRWIKDTQPGDISGAGVKGVWHLARADDVTLQLFNNGTHRYLVDNNNLALYTFDKDKPDMSVCYGDCAVKWPPAYVETDLIRKGIENLRLTGGFGVIQRNDGTYQWSYKGQPLYRWFEDTQPGETKGDGVNNVWHLITQ
ncbi:hypothetical protein G7083_05615 [Vibrio sp. HDW18]|uniref:hypothetical protein n=1 Tax=Vibrio sp. HDW18 TaxID=2714948 RepID=UPI00140960B1|nr:hypothetical protein [Vibrio sp. HDW18]QIL86517.1 hypothetical protein G7083_05615 [Vibrio sp. HDW18]